MDVMMLSFQFFMLLIPISLSQSGQTSEISCSITIPFYCADGSSCIQRSLYCDGVPDCNDGSDEILYNSTLHNESNGISCKWFRNRENLSERIVRSCFLSQQYVCNHEIDCFLGEDESTCAHTFQCTGLPPPFSNQATSQHGVRVFFCDNEKNCLDGSDEKPYRPGDEGYQCAVTKTRITTKCLLPTVHVCDGINDCDDGTDECRCSAESTRGYSNDRCFQCLDETLVVPQRQVCDEKFHCSDLSDECLCPRVSRPKLCDQVCRVGQECGVCKVGQIICKQKIGHSALVCINRTSVCNGDFDCPMGEDEQNCNVDLDRIFNCSDGSSYIPMYQHCNNYPDCPDGSDEVNCQDLHECVEFRYSNLDGRENSYNFANPRYAFQCDKVPDCQDLDDECNSSLCQGGKLPEYCQYTEGKIGFVCPNSKSPIIGKEICDGFPTCNDTAPPYSADEFDCPERFYCEDRGATRLPIHIALTKQCDAISDCYDGSDERGCSFKTHFYCDVGSPSFIKREKVCNSIQDCANGEDECENCAVSSFSSDQFLIESYALQGFLWIIGLFAVIGNVGVLIHSSAQLCRKEKKLTKTAYNHRILVLNLAMADFLLGVYLLGVGIANSVYSGNYCRRDIQWRASTPCLALGTLAVISIECSVFLLTIMATHRLILVATPFKQYVRPRYIYFSVVAAWVVSIILAVVPLSDSLTEYFLSNVWYRHNPFLSITNRNEIENFTIDLWSLQNEDNKVFTNNLTIENLDKSLTWKTMIYSISLLNANYTPEFFYGYYSADGVCLPRFFPDPSRDRSWGFSMLLITLNFVLYVYIFFAYVGIYRYSTFNEIEESRTSTSKNASKTLHHKITRIVVTNFCCWFPICVMAFISVSGSPLSPQAYAVSAIILLPINSGFDPFLYSDLPDLIWSFIKALRNQIVESRSAKRLPTQAEISLTHLTNINTTKRSKSENAEFIQTVIGSDGIQIATAQTAKTKLN